MIFLPSLAHMRPFLVIFWVSKKKISCYIINEHVTETFVNLNFRHFAWNDDVKTLFCIVGTSWMGWGRAQWDWHMGMSYLASMNPQLFKNNAYVGSFKHFSVQFFLHVPILQFNQVQQRLGYYWSFTLFSSYACHVIMEGGSNMGEAPKAAGKIKPCGAI